ncbi:MAG: sulfatase-like hydrolase/transferase [Opitutaceae bacterium]
MKDRINRQRRGFACEARAKTAGTRSSSRIMTRMGSCLLLIFPVLLSALEKPNVVLIMADDLGYGDLLCYGAEMIQTPNIDQLASEGLLFEDYYSAGSVCTPTRYSMMTGFYPFRNDQIHKTEALLISPHSTTLSSVFKQAGYKTAAIGKWHLGYGSSEVLDYGASLRPGPLELGFDYHWGIPRNHNDTVRTYVENDRLCGLDPNQRFAEAEFNKKTKTLTRPVKGLLEERQDDKVHAVLAEKVLGFIRDNKDEPFFVYFTPTIPHTHITPDAPFRGTSEAGQFGDFIHELDHHVGQITSLLDELGLSETTIVVFTSDNGGALHDHGTAGIGLNLADESGDVAAKARYAKNYAKKVGHRTNAQLRGGKASQFEGGFNVPCILRWPEQVEAGTRSETIVGSPDFLMTFAELLDFKIPKNDAGDSFSFLRLLQGTQKGRERTSMVMRHKDHWRGLRDGDWKLIHDFQQNRSELYHLQADSSEAKDLANAETERAAEMKKYLVDIIDERGHRILDDYEIGYKLPDDAVVTHSDSNPLRDALLPVPETAVFKMEGWSLWDPSLIKVGDTYHLFCSRWPRADDHSFDSGWKRSHVIRATSKNLFGPYEFAEVVLHPSEHPWATTGIHNPKITKVGDQFLLYHLGIPQWSTGFAFADSIEGPWVPVPEPVVKANNPALLVRDDGSAYMVSKHKPKPTRDGKWDACMKAHVAKTLTGPYETFGGGRNRLPYDLELEDPTIWWANEQYNVICTDWEGKVTGVQKPVVYYTSKDGIDYELYSKIPVWTQEEPILLEDGTALKASRIERPQVYTNDAGEVAALLVAVGVEVRSHDYIVIRPVDNFVPKN